MTTTRAILTSAAVTAALASALATGAAAQQTAAHGTAAADGLPELFVTAGTCMACHNGLVSPQGMDISIGSNWRGSMMANAARDPYWQAAVRRETMDHPGAAVAIQDECSKCHMPMARFQAHAGGQEYESFGKLPWQRGGASPAVLALAADGVSCTTCHQIEDEGLGTEETFVGEFVIDTERPLGERRVYGPYDIPTGADRAMMTSGLFQPTESEHIRESGLCASCHTLYTHARNDAGEVVGELPEQVPYLEWLHSGYRDERSCQGCHLPPVSGETPISSVLPNPRPNVRQHVFRGGNILVPRMLNLYRDELATAALPAELDAMVNATERFLASRAAELTIPEARLEEGRLVFDVAVTSLAGHKVPTAYPSRRAWLHVTVTRGDEVVFESGALRPDGSIVGNANDEDAARFEPHHPVISDPDQVQIYEAIMVDEGGAVTTGLLYGVEYVKDNRLLPRGFDKATAGADIAVHGRAVEDADFTAPGDRVRYEVDLGAAPGSVAVDVVLRYQPIGFRWARNLDGYDAVETNRFVRYYDSLSHVSSAVLAGTRADIR